MTLTLYWRERSGSFGPHAVIAELGLVLREVRVDSEAGDNSRPDYLALNPTGRIPTLVLADGSVMTESAAMALHLAECHPAAGLAPPPGDPRRARLLRWLFFAVAGLYEPDLRYTYPDRYTADPAGAEGVKQAGIRDVDRNWAIMAGAYGADSYLLGRFSLIDPYVAMMAAWHYAPKALFGRHPALGRLVDAVRGRPALAQLWQRYGFDRDL
jgi:glutathione S-transferase